MKESPEEKIAKLKAQRDKIRSTRDKLKLQLEQLEHYHAIVLNDHFELWQKHVANRYELALPPEENMLHILHRPGVSLPEANMQFLRNGYLLMLQLRHLLAAAGHVLPAGATILDFGSGCARVTRFLGDLAPDAKVFGCDIDQSAIAWDQANLPRTGKFLVSQDRPPLPADLPGCDLIIAISVFTHLPEDMQDQWLAELRSRLNPGGCLIASFHGEGFHRFIPESGRPVFEEKGVLHANLGLTPGLPDYYQTTFHSADYVKNHWGATFKACHHYPLSIDTQDAAVLIKH